MPSVSEKQRRFMGWQLGLKRAGRKTKVDMTEKQLEHYARKPTTKDMARAMARRRK